MRRTKMDEKGEQVKSGEGPPWEIILNYDWEMRQQICEWVRDGGITLKAAMEKVVDDAEVRNLRFMDPCNLHMREVGSAAASGKKARRDGEENWGQVEAAAFGAVSPSPKRKARAEAEAMANPVLQAKVPKERAAVRRHVDKNDHDSLLGLMHPAPALTLLSM